jgi:hypothetical protein
MSEAISKFDTWAIVEAMGHHRYAGRVTEQVIAGASFLRVEIPANGDAPGFTKLLSPASIYAITPVAEDLARGVAAGLSSAPITVYDLPLEMRQKLQAPKPLTIRDFDIAIGDDDDEPY